jgi:hypothetical protein
MIKAGFTDIVDGGAIAIVTTSDGAQPRKTCCLISRLRLRTAS